MKGKQLMLSKIDKEINFDEYSKNDDENLLKVETFVKTIPLKRNQVSLSYHTFKRNYYTKEDSIFFSFLEKST
jgi:hypothetical protein